MVIANSIVGLFTAIGVCISSAGGAIVAWKLVRTTTQTHNIVNSQRTAMLKFQELLIKTLTTAGVDVPADESLESK